jgi:hypothetical protein
VKTYKQIQDEVLESMGDAEDQGTLRSIAKKHIQNYHFNLLSKEQWDFMLWPKTEQITVVVDQKTYTLHPEFFQPLYFLDTTMKQYLEVVPVKQTVETGEDTQQTSSYPDRIQINAISNVQQQPSAAAVITVTTTGGNESSGNSIIVRGIVSGEVREETLSSGSSWSTLTSSLSFEHILSITKVGSSWSRKITITSGSTTVLTLQADEYAKQFQQVEFFLAPQTSNTINYRFYRKPRPIIRDNDVSDLPEGFEELLVLHTKLRMVGFSRATPDEIGMWRETHKELLEQLRQTYQMSRALNSRPRYVTLVERW